MAKIYNRMRRLLPVATNNKQQHPKNRAIQISFVELFVLLFVEIWSLAIEWHLSQRQDI